MTEPDPATFAGAVTVTATATVTHPEGADLSELPVLDPEAGDDEQENNR
jgi:hypothetical protein